MAKLVNDRAYLKRLALEVARSPLVDKLREELSAHVDKTQNASTHDGTCSAHPEEWRAAREINDAALIITNAEHRLRKPGA